MLNIKGSLRSYLSKQNLKASETVEFINYGRLGRAEFTSTEKQFQATNLYSSRLRLVGTLQCIYSYRIHRYLDNQSSQGSWPSHLHTRCDLACNENRRMLTIDHEYYNFAWCFCKGE